MICHWVGCLPERFAQVSCILSLMLETVHFQVLINPHFFSYHVVFSPCYVDKDSDLEMAAKRITWGKFANAGQVWCDHMNIGMLSFFTRSLVHVCKYIATYHLQCAVHLAGRELQWCCRSHRFVSSLSFFCFFCFFCFF